MATLPVSVNISRNTTATKRASFGYPLFVTATVPVGFTERVRIYEDLTSMVDDGFATTDSAYLAAQAHFSQNPAPTKIYIGKELVTDTDLVATFTAIQAENDDWYFVTYESDVEASVLAIAAWAESAGKIYFVSTNDTAVLGAYTAGTNTDLIGKLHDLGYDRTVGIYHHQADVANQENAVIAANATYDAGSVTWNYLDVVGVGVSTNASAVPLTATEQSNLKSRYGNFFGSIAGEVRMIGGRVVSGESISIIRGIDSLTEDLQKSITDLLLNQKGSKLSFSDRDIGKVGAVMEQVLSNYVARDFIFEDYTVTVPTASDVSDADKIAGILNNVTFTATLQGSIDTITISGTVTY